MPNLEEFPLANADYLVFAAYCALLCIVGYWVGRKEKQTSADYFLADRSLPWYVVGGSFITANISSEHFIGMIGSACVYGICVATSEWLNVGTFTLLIWVFIPFLLRAGVFTTAEFLEKRFHPVLRLFFAVVTVISNVTVFLAAVLYGGGLALQELFGWDLWVAIVALGIVAGSWAIYGGLKSVAWIDFWTMLVMLAGGLAVTVLGLQSLAGDGGSILDGFREMLERNRAQSGAWADAVARAAPAIVHGEHYNRLSVLQPVTHEVAPWPSLIFSVFTISIWYNVLNQFMIQRVLGARDMYHARMGIVFAGYVKAFLPVIIVVPGLIMFAQHPEVLTLPWDEVKPTADKGYVRMLHTLVPAGLRGLFLAALFGAIQSTVNSVLNSTGTVLTLDIYKRWIRPNAEEKTLVRLGMWSTTVVLVVSMGLAPFIEKLGGSLFVYIQTMYAFYAPPFAAVFLLGLLWRRINARGAIAAVVAGFLLGIGLKVYVNAVQDHALWIEPYAMQATVNWLFCLGVCTVVSLCSAPPAAACVSDDLCLNWRQLTFLKGAGGVWYKSVLFWWAGFVVAILTLLFLFSELVF